MALQVSACVSPPRGFDAGSFPGVVVPAVMETSPCCLHAAGPVARAPALSQMGSPGLQGEPPSAGALSDWSSE